MLPFAALQHHGSYWGETRRFGYATKPAQLTHFGRIEQTSGDQSPDFRNESSGMRPGKPAQVPRYAGTRDLIAFARAE